MILPPIPTRRAEARRPTDILLGVTDTFAELSILYAIVVAAAAGAFAAFEGRSFADGLWWACVTATTTGYGDLAPVTLGGRLVGAALMHAASWLVFPLITARVAAKLIVNSDAWTHQEQEETKRLLRQIAAATGADREATP